MRRKCFFLTFAMVFMLLVFGMTASASQLIWTPIFPSFGGSPFNGPWLMAQAEAQKPEKVQKYWWQRDPIETFEQDLTRQMLSRLARKIIDNAFGEEAMEPGHYQVGDYVIDITTDAAGINVKIVDPITGNETTVVIPYY